MITTTYICDKCKHAQPSTEQFWQIEIVANNVQHLERYAPSRSFVSDQYKMHVCRNCLEALGIHRKERPPDAPAPPTLEDIITEIVRNTVSDMTGAA